MNVSFVYSEAYDHMLTLMSLQPYDISQEESLKKYLHELRQWWENEEKKIVKEIENVSGLRLPKEVECYVVSQMAYTAISHPMTIRMDRDFDKLRLILIHELIHITLASHMKSRDLVIKLNELYPHKDQYFRSHIPVFMIQKKVLDSLYGPNAMKRYIKEEVTEEEVPILKEADRLGKKFRGNIIKHFR